MGIAARWLGRQPAPRSCYNHSVSPSSNGRAAPHRRAGKLRDAGRREATQGSGSQGPSGMIFAGREHKELPNIHAGQGIRGHVEDEPWEAHSCRNTLKLHTQKSRNRSGVLQSCLSLLNSRQGAFLRAGLRMHLQGVVQLWLLLPGRQGLN